MLGNPLHPLDRLAERTGVRRFIRQDTPARRLKWLPLLLILLATVGLAIEIAAPEYFLWPGLIIMTVPQSLAAVVLHLGPLRRSAHSASADEREDFWYLRANLFTFGIVSVVAVIGAGILGGATLLTVLGWFSLSILRLSIGLIAFAMYVFTLFMMLPTLYASWTLPEIIEDEPEES